MYIIAADDHPPQRMIISAEDYQSILQTIVCHMYQNVFIKAEHGNARLS
jgi:hypothetical protein